MRDEKILIVDDEHEIRESLNELFKLRKYYVKSAQNAEEALSILNKENFDIVLLDVRLPDKNGIDILPEIRHLQTDIQIIIITGAADINDAVNSIKLGAYDYIEKPFSMDEIILRIQKALNWKNIVSENKKLKNQIQDKYHYKGIIGKSDSIKHIINTIKQVGNTDVNVLITGESGTGKELIAKAIHYTGIKKNKPFVAINCSSLPGTLLESELFGYVKGAFTGAYRDKNGLFKVANEGTIFLDEIGDMEFSLQAKILKVLDDGYYMPLGSTKPCKTNARIISATNKDLKTEIMNNKFREDLYYRINVVNINMPPLRERKEDLLDLINYFIEKNRKKLNKKIDGFSNAALEILLRYSWPGNIRELQNVIESSCALTTQNTIDVNVLPDSLFSIESYHYSDMIAINKSLKETLNFYERKYIIELLKFCNGNISKASTIANIARQNMHLKLKQYNIDIGEFRKKKK